MLALRSMCLEALVQCVSIDNVVECVMLADSCSEPRLLKACKEYAACHRYVCICLVAQQMELLV